MTINQTSKLEAKQQVSIQNVKYIIVKVSKKLVWLQRINGKQLYLAAHSTQNGTPVIIGLPRAI